MLLVICLKNTIKKGSINEDNQIGNFIKIIIIVSVIFLGFYGLTLIINKKDKVDETPKAEFQNDIILIGNVLNQKPDKYYVLVEKQDDDNNVLYETYLSVYKNSKDANRAYFATLDNPLNSMFISEESNLLVSNIEKLKLKDVTLLMVSKGKITEAYEGKDDVKLKLSKLADIE